ncbi:MAG: NAD(P)/FAD-dependent oxidoreductase [Leptospirales bacterium]
MNNRHVVILGGGFAGLTAAKTLENEDVEVTLVDARNYYLFQPLLYQVATGDLHAEAVATPIRRLLRGKKQHFVLGKVKSLDPERTLVGLEDGSVLSYDRLVIALGSTTNFFEKKGIAKYAWHLKGLPEAENLRSRILFSLERASQCQDNEERRSWLNFAIAGGGATGVEFACGLLELFHVLIPRDYTEIDPGMITVRILQGGDTLLPGFSRSLQEYAKKRVEALGGEIRFQTHVEEFDGRTVRLTSGESITARTLVWAAGVSAPPLIQGFPGEKGSGGRLRVNDQMQLPEFPNISVVGDLVLPPDENATQVAPFAIQTARHAALAILASWNLVPLPPPFAYKDPGSMVVLGRFDAVCQIPRWGIKCHGLVAWAIWLGLHLAKILGTRNRLLTLVDWGQDYLFKSAAMEILRPPKDPDSLGD